MKRGREGCIDCGGSGIYAASAVGTAFCHCVLEKDLAPNGCAKTCCERFSLDSEGVKEFDKLQSLIPLGTIDPNNGLPQFTCSIWDVDTGMCTRYDERPQLCRSYPEPEKTCAERGCSFKSTV